MAQKIATIVGASGFIGNVLMGHLNRNGWMCWVPSRDHQWSDYEHSLETPTVNIEWPVSVSEVSARDRQPPFLGESRFAGLPVNGAAL